MDQKELERQRDEESRRKLNEHLDKIRKLGRLPTEADEAEEERRFQTDWQRWKQQYSGRIVEFKVEHVDPDADYKLLGVTRKATQPEIRRAFYKLAKTNHPDQGGNADKFHHLMMAYQRLSGGKS
jgi:DnaJ-class molecular chaperone